MTLPPVRIAYLCSDPGIAPDGTKGASVHFRALGAALSACGADVRTFMARRSRAAVDDGAVTIVEPERRPGVGGELAVLASSSRMLATLAADGQHDCVYERLSLFGAAGRAHAQALGIPLFVEVNAPLWEEAGRYRTLELAHTARALAVDVMSAADRVLVVSAALARIVAAAGIERGRIVIEPNGVDAEHFARCTPAAPPPRLRGKRVVTFVGSLKPWHGIEFLLDAARREAGHGGGSWGLWVVGDGPLRSSVERAAADLPAAVHYEGPVPHERVAGILKGSDAAVAPYPADAPGYFSPLKAVEALAAGCPLVASATPCITATCGPGEVELFDPGDFAGFAAALARAFARGRRSVTEGLLEAMSWRAKARRVLDRFGATSAGAA